MRISNNNNISNQNFTSNLSKLSKPLEVFYNKNSVIPILLIETGVTLGRTYEANKTGGKKEAAERFVEQGVSAAVWLWGVQGIKKMFDGMASILKIEKTPDFKAFNMISSTAIATAFIGFGLPKINHFISSKITGNKENEKKVETSKKPLNFDEYKDKTASGKLSFGSLQGFANILENNSTVRLLLTDTGVIAGRCKNGRNKYEKIEGLFRDISSIFFYLFSTDLIVKGLNKLTKNVDIAPSKLEQLVADVKNNAQITDKQSLEFIQRFGVKDIEKSAKTAIHKNFAFYSIGTLISTFALGILIPKVQYAIRKKLTNKTEFPGNDNYKPN